MVFEPDLLRFNFLSHLHAKVSAVTHCLRWTGSAIIEGPPMQELTPTIARARMRDACYVLSLCQSWIGTHEQQLGCPNAHAAAGAGDRHRMRAADCIQATQSSFNFHSTSKAPSLGSFRPEYAWPRLGHRRHSFSRPHFRRKREARSQSISE